MPDSPFPEVKDSQASVFVAASYMVHVKNNAQVFIPNFPETLELFRQNLEKVANGSEASPDRDLFQDVFKALSMTDNAGVIVAVAILEVLGVKGTVGIVSKKT